jgi:hypothetical protein
MCSELEVGHLVPRKVENKWREGHDIGMHRLHGECMKFVSILEHLNKLAALPN